jgi:hypothetical protein
MAERMVKLWYDKEGDILEVFWDNKDGYFTATDHDWVIANVDMEGNVQGFQIEGATKVKDGLLEVRIPSPIKSKEPKKKPT